MKNSKSPVKDPSNLQKNKAEEVHKDSESKSKIDPFMPGTEDVTREIYYNERLKTIREVDVDKEAMWLYVKPKYAPNALDNIILNPKDCGIYVRGEHYLKEIAERTFVQLLQENLKRAVERYEEEMSKTEGEEEYENKSLESLIERIDDKIRRTGITNHEISEILHSLRRKTFVDPNTMNRGNYIIVADGMINLKTWSKEDFSASPFFTWKVNGRYDPAVKSLNQVPMFKNFLMSVYPPEYIPLILDYMAYCLHPGFPRQKILGIFGPPRMGKGTTTKIMEKIIPDGFGRFSLMKLLIPDNKFALQSIENRNLLIDNEIRRDFKRSADFDTVNSLFGGDPLPVEKKFHAEHNYVSRAKGILVGNLPLFHIDNMPFLSRLLIVLTKSERSGPEIPDLADKIWNAEKDQIVPLLLNRLKGLMARNFRFSNEKSLDQTAAIWERLADSVSAFVEDATDTEFGKSVPVDDAYRYYVEYCEARGIPAEKQQSFTFRFAKHYKKGRVRINGILTYVFQDCAIVTTVEIKKDDRRGDMDDLLGDIL